MLHKRRPTLAAPPPDPFGERRPVAFRERLQLLGGEFEFATDRARLLRIVRQAYARLPPHKFGGTNPRFKVRLVLTPGGTQSRSRREPPPVRNLAAAGLLCGAMDRANFVALTPQQRSALIVLSSDKLRYPYHIRYELLEFAVYVLASRAQRLVPLHAACFGKGEQGVLVMGASGSGKSTLALHALLSGLDFLAEDSVLVDPRGVRATGVANFLHLRPDSLRFLAAAERALLIEKSSVVRRRSGVTKLEIDLRRPQFRLAARPLRIRALLFLSSQRVGRRGLLTPLSASEVQRRLVASQRYAAQQPGWRAFRAQACRLPGYQLRRGAHPRAAAEAVRELLARMPARRARAPRPSSPRRRGRMAQPIGRSVPEEIRVGSEASSDA